MRIPRYVRFLPADLRFAGYHLLVNTIGGSPLVPRGLRILIYRLAGMRVGRANLYHSIIFHGTGPVSIGNNAMLNATVEIDNRMPVTIGEGVHIAFGVLIATSSHEIGPSEQRASPQLQNAPVSIGRGSWIGARSIILPGITIGAGVVIAAGSVVTSDCKPNRLYAGIPARPIRQLS